MEDGMGKVLYKDLGVIAYGEAWDFQEGLFNKLIAFKREPEGKVRPQQYLLFCEHPHVYTLGKSGDEANLLIHKEFLQKITTS